MGMGTLSETTNMQASVLAGIVMLVVSTDGQQMCLEVNPDYPLPRDSTVTFEDVSTMGTSTIEESLVDVSLANTTGEIKIKIADPYFYLVVKASKRPRYTDSRNARLFLLVNGKVPLRGAVWVQVQSQRTSYDRGVPQGGWDSHREPHYKEPQPHDALWHDRLLH